MSNRARTALVAIVTRQSVRVHAFDAAIARRIAEPSRSRCRRSRAPTHSTQRPGVPLVRQISPASLLLQSRVDRADDRSVRVDAGVADVGAGVADVRSRRHARRLAAGRRRFRDAAAFHRRRRFRDAAASVDAAGAGRRRVPVRRRCRGTSAPPSPAVDHRSRRPVPVLLPRTRRGLLQPPLARNAAQASQPARPAPARATPSPGRVCRQHPRRSPFKLTSSGSDVGITPPCRDRDRPCVRQCHCRIAAAPPAAGAGPPPFHARKVMVYVGLVPRDA